MEQDRTARGRGQVVEEAVVTLMNITSEDYADPVTAEAARTEDAGNLH